MLRLSSTASDPADADNGEIQNTVEADANCAATGAMVPNLHQEGVSKFTPVTVTFAPPL